MYSQRIILVILTNLLMSFAVAAPRDVQIKTVNFSSQAIELHNFGLAAQSLTGWRLCSHDGNQVDQCTAAAGLNGVSIAADSSLEIRLNNDASLSNHINASTLGGSFATPFDHNAYGLQLYFAPVNLGDGNTIADHLQWNIDGLDNTSADERSDEAQNGNVWVDQNAWIATTTETKVIKLTDETGFTNHSPTNYELSDEFNIPFVPAAFAVGLAGLLVGISIYRKQ